MGAGSAPLGRTPRVHDPGVGGAHGLRQVAVPVDDDVTAGKALSQALIPPSRRSPVVHQPDPMTLGLDDGSIRQRRLELAFVHVSVHGLDATQLTELRKHGRGGEVAGVKNQIRLREELQALDGEGASAPREVRVADEGDQSGPATKRPSR